MLLEILRQAGHDAVAAGNGFDALKHLRASPVDLVVTDMMMPYSGLAMIRIVHEEFPGLRIIAMSGGSEHRLDYARNLGAQQALTKPFSAEQLLAAVKDVLAAPPVPPPKPEA